MVVSVKQYLKIEHAEVWGDGIIVMSCVDREQKVHQSQSFLISFLLFLISFLI